MKRHLIDLAERTGATFAQAFLAVLTVSTLTDLAALKIAGAAGAYAVGKFLLVKANAYLGTPEPQTQFVPFVPPIAADFPHLTIADPPPSPEVPK